MLGSGAIPLATAGDRRAFVAAAGGPIPSALANNVYSADIVALSGAVLLRGLGNVPDLPADNALPRWLAEVAGVPVSGFNRWRLGFDLDSPLDLLLAGRAVDAARLRTAGIDFEAITGRLARVRAVLADRRAELIVAGRTSAGTLRALERGATCRIRALVEERGLRAASILAHRACGGAAGTADGRGAEASAASRPPRSTLGLLVDRDGPGALGALLAELGDGAVIDTRVLLAHQFGADEAGWPSAEDRFAADLLLPDRIADPWLRALVTSLRDAPIPIIAGGHTLVGPGIRLLAARRRVSTPAEDAIRAEIAAHGPIPFARFMALALGHPEGGYYTGPQARPTRGAATSSPRRSSTRSSGPRSLGSWLRPGNGWAGRTRSRSWNTGRARGRWPSRSWPASGRTARRSPTPWSTRRSS